MTAKTLDVVGIGNAIVDVLVQTEEAFLANHALTKGTMALVDEAQAERLYGGLGPGLETSGGSAANTLAGIAQLGSRAGFIGRVRDDQLGAIFAHDIRSVGARFETPAATTGASTARSKSRSAARPPHTSLSGFCVASLNTSFALGAGHHRAREPLRRRCRAHPAADPARRAWRGPGPLDR